jgi:riboflavin kinase/FMN adenylyltransferase
MAIFRHTDDLPPEARGAVVAIGNFDGVHLGHRALLAEALRLAEDLGAPLGVLTFEPHPRSVFRPEDPPFRLTPLRARTHALEALGVEHLYVLHFDLSFAAETAESFVRRILVEGLAARHVVVGRDFRFGHKRAGDAALLERLGRHLGFGVSALAPVAAVDGVVYSSSTIRRYLSEGRPDEAARLLGRPWQIEGRVEAGDARGRDLGFPTANLGIDGYLVPALGAYAVRVMIDEAEDSAWRPAVANLGWRPTVDGSRILLEAHLFDFASDLYGRHLRIRLFGFLRPEKKFDGLEDLQAQIARDCHQARVLLAG